ncbi:hypothetical protein L3X38_034380 [Prunus dulcis]|uniref:Secreted protein n=1 Tax=Prunus dulcis TaxID=3755 RepID=A0AAD4VJZ0_PRUDU|nr:hypothetical protein L3X38_034380 [Prunus dulcis]
MGWVRLAFLLSRASLGCMAGRWQVETVLVVRVSVNPSSLDMALMAGFLNELSITGPRGPSSSWLTIPGLRALHSHPTASCSPPPATKGVLSCEGRLSGAIQERAVGAVRAELHHF